MTLRKFLFSVRYWNLCLKNKRYSLVSKWRGLSSIYGYKWHSSTRWDWSWVRLCPIVALQTFTDCTSCLMLLKVVWICPILCSASAKVSAIVILVMWGNQWHVWFSIWSRMWWADFVNLLSSRLEVLASIMMLIEGNCDNPNGGADCMGCTGVESWISE